MTRVLLHTDDPDTALEVVTEAHSDLTPAICEDYEGLEAALGAYEPEVVYSCRFSPAPFPRDALLAAPSVRWISNAGSGVNHLMPWDPARITVTNSAGVAAEAMAEYALSCFLHFAMDRPGLMADQAARVWRARNVAPLFGRTLLCVGLGKTGRRMATLGAALGMRVLGVRASGSATENVERVWAPDQMAVPIAAADFVLVCLPLTDATFGLIGPREFSAMKPGAVYVDISRGGVTDEAALIAALKAKRISGAALDVFGAEPLPADSPLWSSPRLLISPHCSGLYEGWERRSLAFFVENLTRWRKGEVLENVVAAEKGY